jgi:hypothetical protein
LKTHIVYIAHTAIPCEEKTKGFIRSR